MRRYLFVTMVVVLVATSIALGRGQSPGGAPTKAWRFETDRQGRALRHWHGPDDHDEQLDGHRERRPPDAGRHQRHAGRGARAGRADQGRDSPKPIKYVFNSHYHFDHAHGNQIFGDDVEIIGHEYIRKMHLSNVIQQRTNKSFTEVLPSADRAR